MTTVSNKGRSFRSCSESVLWRGRTGDAFESPRPLPVAFINRGPVRCLVKTATMQTKSRMTEGEQRDQKSRSRGSWGQRCANALDLHTHLHRS